MKSTMPKTYEVWSYDVWGNAEDGYEVNDRCKIGTVELPDKPTEKDVLEAISEYWDISQVDISNAFDWEFSIEIVGKDDEFEPVGQLVPE